jgi:hypothetical protein
VTRSRPAHKPKRNSDETQKLSTTTSRRQWGNMASSAIPNLYRRGIHRKVSKADCYAPGGQQGYVSHPFFLLIVVIRPSLLFTASSPPHRLSRTHSAKGRKRGDCRYIYCIISYFDPWDVEWGDILGENDIIRYLVFFSRLFRIYGHLSHSRGQGELDPTR